MPEVIRATRPPTAGAGRGVADVGTPRQISRDNAWLDGGTIVAQLTAPDHTSRAHKNRSTLPAVPVPRRSCDTCNIAGPGHWSRDEVPTMHARVSRFRGGEAGVSPPRAEEVLPALRNIDGFRGLISLVDRASGDALAITLWESEDAMRASEARADEMRREMAAASGDEIRGVERYEVDALQLEP